MTSETPRDGSEQTGSLIRGGITAEYFLAAFLEPGSGYSLGKIVQNRKSPSSKNLYPYIEKLKKEGYLLEKNGKLFPNLRKFVAEMSQAFSDQVELSHDDGMIITSLLENREFFKVVSDSIKDEMTKQPDRIHKIDALKLIADKIGMMAATYILFRTEKPDPYDQSGSKKSLKDVKEEYDILHSTWNTKEVQDKIIEMDRQMTKQTKKTKKEIEKTRARLRGERIREKDPQKRKELTREIKKPKPNVDLIADSLMIMFKSFTSLRLLFVVPEELLWKMTKLWKDYPGFEIAYKVSEHMKNMKL